ncbi:DNA cytosine methyltransferase [Sporolactobacillus inulinus]|uniref:DNA cytosine methyltransferase n=1 Tax=Sporolactobacillus inulinus TaxID=2078 RepID=UPI0021CCDD94|nr:DNA cytosine methyltransferase [Sporolactobacillus inulinus]
MDLFAGGGGFSTGFQMAKLDNYSFEIIRAVEINDDACNTLRSHLGTKRVIQGDITTKENKEENLS